MANPYQSKSTSSDQWPNITKSPVSALTTWSSLLSGVNALSVGELGIIMNEWQDFVRRRLEEDAALLQRLTRSAGPHQVLAAYAEFWRKAGEDYGNELATMTKLVTDMRSKVAVAAQSATEEASTAVRPQGSPEGPAPMKVPPGGLCG